MERSDRLDTLTQREGKEGNTRDTLHAEREGFMCNVETRIPSGNTRAIRET